jgi:hypothetical protein
VNKGLKNLRSPEAQTKKPLQCPECDHVFKGKGWEGIDAHWRTSHNHIKSYEEAWPEIEAVIYVSESMK